MESLWRSSAFTDSDLNYFRYKEDLVPDQPLSTRICVKSNLLGQDNWLDRTQGRFVNEWNLWLDTAAPKPPTTEDHFALVISSRLKPAPHETIFDFPRLLRHLSISKASFKSIITKLKLHRALVVLLDRGASVISRIQCKINNTQYQVYTLRLDHGLEHQTAMTITYFPKSAGTAPQPASLGSKTNAMILGYEDIDIDELLLRFRNCKESIFAPFTIIKAFLQVESKRRFKEVNHKIAKFLSILENYGLLPIGEEGKDQANSGGNAQNPKNLIGLYIDVCTLKNQLTAHLSRLNAQNALRDGKQMKAIALLTMFFLPGTFIATLMAVPEFENMKMISGLPEWSWYLVLFLPLTAVVLGAYLLWTNYYTSEDQKTLAHMV